MADLPLSEDSCSSGMNPSEKFMLFFDLHSYTNRKKRSFGSNKRLRTPRSLTRLMQQHRDGERHRHRGLNASIEEICKQVPGYNECGYHTKIGKLTMITNYICYLEEYIQELCEEVGLDLDFKNLFLSPHVKELANSEACHVGHVNQTLDITNKSALVSTSCWQGHPGSLTPAETWVPRKLTVRQGPEYLSSSSTDSSDTLPEYIFPGTSSYDPFGTCDSSDAGSYHASNNGQSVPQTPMMINKGDWLNDGSNEDDRFLSPEMFSFLQAKTSDVDAISLCSPMAKVDREDEHDSEYSNYLEIVPDDAIPVLFDTEVITEVELSSSPGNSSDQKTEVAVRSDTRYDLTPDLNVVQSSDKVHVVPHLEGMDLSDEEGDNKDLLLLSKKQTMQRSEMKLNHEIKSGNEEQFDDMFVSHLQKIEEDENDYNLCVRSSDLLVSEAGSSGKSIVHQAAAPKSLFTPLQLLMDAGLSPQYMKAGCSNIACSPACSPASFKNSADTITGYQSLLKMESEPNNFPISETSVSKMMPEDSCHSLDSCNSLTFSPQSSISGTMLVSRNSTPVDSDYGSLAAEPVCAALSRGEQSLDGRVVSCDDGHRLQLTRHKDGTEEQSARDNSRTRSSDLGSSVRPRMDYRKVSWMNGFMMFSCLNRKKISEKNHGLHASQITKLLGIEWRQMSAEQQSPYRRRASQYVKELLAKTYATEQ